MAAVQARPGPEPRGGDERDGARERYTQVTDITSLTVEHTLNMLSQFHADQCKQLDLN